MSKYRVKVGDQIHEVRIQDVTTHPVIASIGDQQFQVWIQEEEGPQVNEIQPIASTASAIPQAKPAPPVQVTPDPHAVAAQPHHGGNGGVIVRAPMPGQIIQVNVSAGEQVERGAVLCVLEAMKMNNQIRAPREGVVAAVHTQEGTQVNYGDPLIALD